MGAFLNSAIEVGKRGCYGIPPLNRRPFEVVVGLMVRTHIELLLNKANDSNPEDLICWSRAVSNLEEISLRLHFLLRLRYGKGDLVLF